MKGSFSKIKAVTSDFSALIFSLIIFISCKEEDVQPLPLIQTLEVTDITPTQATLNGKIVDLNNSKVIDHGFVYSNGTITDRTLTTKISLGQLSSPGVFSMTIVHLASGKDYYIKAYATNEAGRIVYGEEVKWVY